MQRFAGKGDVYLRDIDNPKKKVKQILWGDWLNIEETEGEWGRVKWGAEKYWIALEDCVEERPLEVVFVDVGQGDGCLVVSPHVPPDEKVMLIDAGVGDNMYRFISWRFGKLAKKFRFHAAIITHSDKDHYYGFKKLFEQEKFSFDHVYHNGIAERAGDELFGPSDESGEYVADLKPTHKEIETLYKKEQFRKGKQYAELIYTALTNDRVDSVDMLSTVHGTIEKDRAWMPGFAPSDNEELTIEILGPVVETIGGKPMLRWFGNTVGSKAKDNGKTKNGHSVLLRLCYRNFTLLFGGDLNLPAEDFLLRHYGEIAKDQPLRDAVDKASRRLKADVMKSCHHGSADVTDEFLQAVKPFAFVVSSGDEESHAHPRPDLLGRLGRHGRGDAPLILCTEILRSTREKEDQKQLKRLQKLDALIESAKTTAKEKREYQEERAKIQGDLARRNVETYGAITLRTDGRHLKVAFRLEKPRGGGKLWQIYSYEHDETHGFVPLGENGH